jgi:UDP-N-acetylmuramoylalanine--D-glutamate ligase
VFDRFKKKKPEAPAPEPKAPQASRAPQAPPAPEPAPETASGPIPLKGSNVAVFGFGASGRAAARLLLREGATVTALDEGDPAVLSKAAKDLGVAAHTGDPAACLTAADLVVLSPGVPMAHPAVVAAKDKGIPVIAEVELAWRHLNAPLIGITGTNGKSTVTAMTGHVLSGWKERVFTGGNLGEPLSEAALATQPWDLVVCELSSFQLEGVTSLAPVLACIVNTAPDHMDRYDGESAYYMAKFRIFLHMKGGYALLNARDPRTPIVVEHHLKGARPVRFNLPDDAPPDADGVRAKDGAITVTTGGRTVKVMDLPALTVAGAQNVENAQAAAALCLLVGCPVPVVAKRLATFTGLPHRMQPVATDDGLTWIDDSKATNPSAVVKAIEGLEGPVTLLLGGRAKGAGGDLFALREPIFLKVRRVVVFGEAAEKFRVVLQGYPGLSVAEGLEDAVADARANAQPGETVLLSPACASFDEFRDYAHRGDSFAAWARAKAETA